MWEFIVNFEFSAFKVSAPNLRKEPHKAGCIFPSWDAATAGVRTDEVRCFFVTQQMLGGVGWLWVVIETGEKRAEAAGAGSLRLSQQMSAALEGKEVRTVSNRRVAAIHLLQALCNVSRWTRDVLGQGGRLPCEEKKLLLHVLGPALFLQSDLQLKLHFNGGFLAPRRPVRCWNMMHLFYCAGKNVPSS